MRAWYNNSSYRHWRMRPEHVADDTRERRGCAAVCDLGGFREVQGSSESLCPLQCESDDLSEELRSWHTSRGTPSFERASHSQ